MRKYRESIIIVAILFLLGMMVFFWSDNSHRDSIKQWTENHGKVVRVVEPRTLRIGPFFYMKNTMVYRVETTDNTTYWFRYGLFVDAVYKENADGTYTELE